MCQAPDALRSVIPANVNAVEGGLRVSTIHIAAGNGVAVLPSVGEDRGNVNRAFLAVAVREWFETFVNVPAMVFAASNYVHFLDAILPHIAHPKVAAYGIKTEPPRFPKAISPNLASRVPSATKWVVGRNSVGQGILAAVHINPEHFTQQELKV